MKGYIQVYTGEGKGKTTASLGLALRAAGAGLRVYIGQFMKTGDNSEIKALSVLSGNIEVEQFGRKRKIGRKIEEADRICAQRGLQRVKMILQDADYDLVILDEINVVLNYGLIDLDDLIEIIKNRPPTQEIVSTGRDAPERFIKLADLVTEMKMIKHYIHKGVKARAGIEK